MSFDNDYPNRKDRRQPYYRSKRFDRSCRNHGGCPYCEGNRTHHNKRREPIEDCEEDHSDLLGLWGMPDQ
jgi:hypothetical protein